MLEGKKRTVQLSRRRIADQKIQLWNKYDAHLSIKPPHWTSERWCISDNVISTTAGNYEWTCGPHKRYYEHPNTNTTTINLSTSKTINAPFVNCSFLYSSSINRILNHLYQSYNPLVFCLKHLYLPAGVTDESEHSDAEPQVEDGAAAATTPSKRKAKRANKDHGLLIGKVNVGNGANRSSEKDKAEKEKARTKA